MFWTVSVFMLRSKLFNFWQIVKVNMTAHLSRMMGAVVKKGGEQTVKEKDKISEGWDRREKRTCWKSGDMWMW